MHSTFIEDVTPLVSGDGLERFLSSFSKGGREKVILKQQETH